MSLLADLQQYEYSSYAVFLFEARQQATIFAHALLAGIDAPFRHLGLDRTRQERTRAIAQNFGKRIGEGPWQG
jgi:hypothetical protein